MTATEIIEMRLKEKNIMKTDLANHLEITKQNLWNKLNRDNFTITELNLICDFLDMKLIIKDDVGTEYSIKYNE